MEIFHHFIYSLRHEYLTYYFNIYPLIINEYILISIIALGYWCARDNKIYKELGFLLPLTIYIAITLKAIFKISRPDIIYHLLPTHDPFGFPSGDVLIAVTFFGLFILKTRYNILKILLIFLIINVMFSRVYLGVHSIYDIFGGLLFGIIIVYIWQTKLISALFDNWLNNNVLSYWIFLIAIIVGYEFIFTNNSKKTLIAVYGMFIGLGLSFSYIKTHQNFHFKKMVALLMLFIVIILTKFFPTSKANAILLIFTTAIKYSFITLVIYKLLPLMVSCLNPKYIKAKLTNH